MTLNSRRNTPAQQGTANDHIKPMIELDPVVAVAVNPATMMMGATELELQDA
jgi:hypothetical protein